MLKGKPNRYLLAIAGLGVSLAMAMPAFARYYSASDCAYRAEQAARNTYGAVGGAVTGAAGGAAIGAIVSSNSRRGARKGAAIGAAVGGTSGAVRKTSTYRRVYDDCMAGRLR
jgi:ferric-dicitrate binding protein FerR (iron transport regulator)